MPNSVPVFAAWDLFAWLTEQMQNIVLNFLSNFIGLIETSPEPHLTASWFRGEYSVMLQMALMIMAPMVMAATVGALLYGGIQQVLRIYLWALPLAVLGGVAAIAVVELCIAIDNEMTAMVFSSSRQRAQAFYDALNSKTAFVPLGDTANAGWSFVQFMMMSSLVLPMFFLVFEMIFRQIMIYMAVMFLPLSLAAFLWGPIRSWFYNLSELLVTMVFAKFVIASIISLGFTAMSFSVSGGGGNPSDQSSSLVLGFLVVIILACLAGPVMVAFIMQPGHAILSFKSAKQVTPWNHDRKWAASLMGKQWKMVKNLFK